MSNATYSDAAWRAPLATRPLAATVHLPGSKSLTNRELVLSALADGPSRLRRPLRARDTDLMIGALRALGARIEEDGEDLIVRPGPLTGGVTIDVGLAGTLMRFLPPLAALADGPVTFDGDPRARMRPTATTILSLRGLGVAVDDGGRGSMPFTVSGTGHPDGGPVLLDASQSSQFVSGLLLSAPRFHTGIDVEHRGARLPSVPHIDMTVDALRRRHVKVEVEVDDGVGRWSVGPHRIAGRDLTIEPDLSNAAPFLAAALVAGGTVTVPDWPEQTTQAGDHLREVLSAFGADVYHRHGALTVDGHAGARTGALLDPVDLELGDYTELVPTLAGLAAFASAPSRFRGIQHMRGHETDRLAALTTELTLLGATTSETADGIVVQPGSLTAADRPWASYADHRMATTGALLGLAVDGLEVDDVATTAKTMPEFPALWRAMLA